MRDLTFEECSLVNGGDLFEELCSGLGNLCHNMFGYNPPPQNNTFTNDQLVAMQTACITALASSHNGGTAYVTTTNVSVNASGMIEVPVTLSGGAIQQSAVCTINPATGKATIK